MTADVIQFGKKKDNKAEFQFTMDFSIKDGEWFAEIVHMREDGKEHAERMRYYVERLASVAFRKQRMAEEIGPSEHGKMVATATIYADAAVSVRAVSSDFTDEDQKVWLVERFDDAKKAAMKIEVGET